MKTKISLLSLTIMASLVMGVASVNAQDTNSQDSRTLALTPDQFNVLIADLQNGPLKTNLSTFATDERNAAQTRAKIHDLTQSVAMLNAQIKDLRKSKTATESTIKNLKSQKDYTERLIKEIKEQESSLKDQNKKLRASLKELHSSYTVLRLEIEDETKNIARRKNYIRDLTITLQTDGSLNLPVEDILAVKAALGVAEKAQKDSLEALSSSQKQKNTTEDNLKKEAKLLKAHLKALKTDKSGLALDQSAVKVDRTSLRVQEGDLGEQEQDITNDQGAIKTDTVDLKTDADILKTDQTLESHDVNVVEQDLSPNHLNGLPYHHPIGPVHSKILQQVPDDQRTEGSTDSNDAKASSKKTAEK